ncbi:hypothetical protein QBC35DRAFT_424201 [Podospora australis]|uniref:Uncharacterized protein n=1 Tax=Podospora australis TaxID=1536484 RepID=A0AAN6X1V7_9PEZI|nr:hypothetical protein QBC35DRAFT_424201 [Podospora australis]
MVSRTQRPAQSKRVVYCEGNPKFDPAAAVQERDNHERAMKVLNERNAFDEAIRIRFGIGAADGYVYHAVASVTLSQVQRAVAVGRAHGMHDWYEDFETTAGSNNGVERKGGEGEDVSLFELNHPPPPTPEDIKSYISIFSPATSTPAALKAFLANAKKNSIRHAVAEYLCGKRFLSASIPEAPKVKPPSLPKLPVNPSYDFWAWSCLNLEWCGPLPPSLKKQQRIRSHHVLPVMMHHFGCAVPSHEALSLLKALTLPPAGSGNKGQKIPNKRIADLGSGNGYWTFMLRQYGVEVDAVDNGQSEWRVNWIPNTLPITATSYLSSQENNHSELVLLLVYPIVASDGSFTREILEAYKGDTIAVVGTQNRNGYTAFKDKTMDEYMTTEHGDTWEKTVQIPLPSFAGKDEALFVFQRRRGSLSEGVDGNRASPTGSKV